MSQEREKNEESREKRRGLSVCKVWFGACEQTSATTDRQGHHERALSIQSRPANPTRTGSSSMDT